MLEDLVGGKIINVRYRGRDNEWMEIWIEKNNKIYFVSITPRVRLKSNTKDAWYALNQAMRQAILELEEYVFECPDPKACLRTAWKIREKFPKGYRIGIFSLAKALGLDEKHGKEVAKTLVKFGLAKWANEYKTQVMIK